jgi:aminoglycoside 3-N-acetyltransferase I
MEYDYQIMRLNKTGLVIAEQLFLLFQQVFDAKHVIVQKTYLKKLLNRPDFICFAATYKNEVIGGLTAYELPMYHSETSEMFIYDIAVKPAFQRKGIGKKLLLAAKEYGKQNGMQEIFVDANEEDQHALDFYRSMNGREEKVVQFSYPV